jgi:cytidyltransferase-like protein
VRFLQEASKQGSLTVLVWPDALVKRMTGTDPKFPLAERLYFLNALRYVDCALPLDPHSGVDELPQDDGFHPAMWVDPESPANEARRRFCDTRGIEYVVIHSDRLRGFPEDGASNLSTGRKKVVVTGCYDWLHSGHIRFFEEVSAYGDLIVIVGHDENIRLLKGAGHPLQPQTERRYMAGAVRYVAQASVSTGHGWLDAEPEILRLRPDIYAVNEDGDRGGKRDFCARHGIEYLVLKRVPAPGLPSRTSTSLRGF